MNLRIASILLLAGALSFELSSSTTGRGQALSRTSDLTVVALCELVNNPGPYFDKRIQVKAIYFENSESNFLYSVECPGSKNFVGMVCGATAGSCSTMRETINKNLFRGEDKLAAQSNLVLIGHLKLPPVRYLDLDGRLVTEIPNYQLEFSVEEIRHAEPVQPLTPMPKRDRPAVKKATN
jgi:hypothetical protein